jgi:hypothetical protein
VTGDHEGRAFEIVVGERAAQRLNRGQRLRADVGRVVVEVDLEVDLLADNERVDRPRIFWTNLPSAADTAGSAVCCGPTERPRVSGFFSGASARTI